MTIQIANKDGYRFGEQAYLVGNEFGVLCISYGNNEQESLDNAVDAGFMDCQLMSETDHLEHEANGWQDSYIYAGNSSEPFWSEYLWVKPASERKREVTA